MTNDTLFDKIKNKIPNLLYKIMVLLYNIMRAAISPIHWFTPEKKIYIKSETFVPIVS